MRALAAELLLVAGVPALGWLVGRLLGWRPGSRAVAFAVSIALGFVATALLLYGQLAVGLELAFAPLVAVHVGALLVVAVFVVRGRIARPSPWAFALLLPCAAIASLAARTPYWGYDAKAIYGYKAKVLLHERDIDGAPFQEVDVVHYHADYPLGVPLLAAYSGWAAHGDPEGPAGVEPAASAGEWVARYAHVDAYSRVAVLWIAGVIALVFGATGAFGAARGRPLGPVARGVLVFLAVPAMLALPWAGGRSWSLEAGDVPLALCVGVAGIVLLEREGGASRPARIVAALAGGGAFLFKNDALIGIATLGMALVALDRGAWRSALALVLGSGAFLAVVRAVAARIPESPFDEDYGDALIGLDLQTFQRVPELLGATYDALERRGLRAYWAVVLFVGVPLGWRAGGRERVLAVWIVLFLLAAWVLFLATPNNIRWHVNTALPRLWAQATVATGSLVVLGAGRLFAGMLGGAK